MKQPILVTSALPYANGDLHLGHMVEYIQTDILVRFLKLSGHDVIYVCADDTHGTPIEVKARNSGITPEELIAHYFSRHQQDFAAFDVAFDCFDTTNSPENEQHCITIFNRLREGGHIVTRTVEQYYCPQDARFLPDRFIRGTCPNPSCRAEDQYGDVCEVCGTTYNPTDLGDARCAICGQPPRLKESLHYFFQLGHFEEFLKEWVREPSRLQPEVRRSLEGWFQEGLRDWDISRDGPYFGFRIPGEDNKYFYVWLDAPVGYVAATEKYCRRKGLDFDSFWHNPEATIYHVIGKDIIYFHTLFWPATLKGGGYTLPRRILVHGFLTVNGERMSKSRGTFIKARTYLAHLDPQYLRYYYAAKLGSGLDDLDLNLEDFTTRVNAELVNKIANLVSRAVPFLERHFEGRLGRLPRDAAPLLEEARRRVSRIGTFYEAMEFRRAIQEIVAIADSANKYFQDNAPWAALHTDPERAREVLTLAINCCRCVAALIKPVLPGYAGRLERILRIEPLSFPDASRFDLEEHTIGPFERLVERVRPEDVRAMLEASRGNREEIF